MDDEVRSVLADEIRSVIERVMPNKEEILEAIRQGVHGAFPYAELILGAIADGTKEALEKKQ